MIYYTQLIYIRPGFEAIFDQFEDVALSLLKQHNGQLLLRCRPNQASFIETELGQPYEIHLVSFETRQDFENFAKDPERAAVLHFKDQSVEKVVLVEGKMI